MTVEDVSRLLIVLAAGDWALTLVIYSSARSLREPALTERAVAAIVLSVVATIGALIGGSVLGMFRLDRGVTTILLASAFALVSVPQVIWAIGLLTGRFR